MKFDIITIFPQILDSYLNESILKRAQLKKFINIKVHNLRKFSKDKHKKVDDRPFGGGPGMVLKIEPIIRAVSSIKRQASKGKTKVIIFSAGGKQFDDKMAQKLAKEKQIIMICGRYEGVDERIKKVLENCKLKIENLSVGPYVLTGGELPAMILIDSISRKIPGVLGKLESLEEKRNGVGIPAYTRPAEFIYSPDAFKDRGSDQQRRRKKKYKVPEVLLSGDHKKIEEWKRKFKK